MNGLFKSIKKDPPAKSFYAMAVILLGMFAAAQVEAGTQERRALVDRLEAEVTCRSGRKPWASLAANAFLDEGAEIKTGAKGRLSLRFADGSEAQVEPLTEMKLESLHNAENQTLIQIILEGGEINAHVTPETACHESFVVHTPVATAVGEGTAFSVLHQPSGGLTTISAEEGEVFIQPESSEIQPLNLQTGKQVSLSSSAIGPVVAKGAPPGLLEPKLPYKLLDLGYWQECESRHGQEEICGTWTWDAQAQAFTARWQDGVVALVKVEKMEGGEIILLRRDLSGSSEGSGARYTGHSKGGDFEGDTVIQLLEGTVVWDSSAAASKATWHARVYNSYLELGEASSKG